MTNDDKLTSSQVDAITHSWLDLSATAQLSGKRGVVNRRAVAEVAVAARDSVVELETAFPFLRDQT